MTGTGDQQLTYVTAMILGDVWMAELGQHACLQQVQQSCFIPFPGCLNAQKLTAAYSCCQRDAVTHDHCVPLILLLRCVSAEFGALST